MHGGGQIGSFDTDSELPDSSRTGVGICRVSGLAGGREWTVDIKGDLDGSFWACFVELADQHLGLLSKW